MNDAGPSPARLLDGLAALLDNHPHTRHLIVGYSGGLDSHVLLHLLATNRACWPGRTLAAVYVDHGLQAASADWGEHCAHICHELDIPFRVLRIDARPLPGESPEAAARRARYTDDEPGRRRHHLTWALSAGLLAAFTGMALHGLVDAVTWGTKLAFLPWLCYALAVALYRGPNRRRRRRHRTPDPA